MSKSQVTTSQAASPIPAVLLAPPEVSTAKRGYIAEALTNAAEGLTVDPETKHLMIAEVAYYCAEKRGFAPGGELQDWLDAEAQVTALLR